MLIYFSFIHLKNKKSGSTFALTGLNRFCTEPPMTLERHTVLDTKSGKLCFTTIRELLARYRSLCSCWRESKSAAQYSGLMLFVR